MDTRHRIRSLDFDLTFASGGMAMSQGDPLRALVVDQLLPVVASVFDEATGDGAAADIYRIDRLDVDLGEVYAEDLPETLAERLAEALASVLVMWRGEGSAVDGAAEHSGAGEGIGGVGIGSRAVGSGHRGSAVGQRQPDGADASVQSQAASRPHVSKFATAATADATDLMAFLASGQWVRPGSMPGSVQTEPNHVLRRDEGPHRDTDAAAADGIEALLARVLAGDVQTVRQRIRASASSDTLIQRLAKQFPADGVEALIRALRPAEASGWLRQLGGLDRLLESVGWNSSQRAEAQTAARARLLTMGLLPPGVDLREMPWHGVWQAVLSIASVRGLVHDELDFVAKVREHTRADEGRAGAEDAARTGQVSQAGSARSPMIDALHRVAEAKANGAVREGGMAGFLSPDATPSAIHDARSGGLPHAPVLTSNASPRSLTRSGLKALLATALMRAQAKALYGVWPTLVANEADTLREALRRYLSVSDLREHIALTFPVSMLEDMLTLLVAVRLDVTQGSARGYGKETDATVVATSSQSTGHDVNRTWGWRNAWSNDIAAVLGIYDSDAMPAAVGAPADRSQASTRGGNRLTDGDRRDDDGLPLASSDTSSTGLAHRSIGGEPTSAEPAVPPSVADAQPTSDDFDPHVQAKSRRDTLIQALLSGSAVALHDDWAEWTGAERAALASIWRHYATYDTVLMRVVEGFPETMLVDLATVTVPSAAAIWEAFAEVSVGQLVDAVQVSASSIERPPGDTSRVLDGFLSLAHTGGRETHAEPITRNVPSQTEFDRWKREVWHEIFMRLRAIAPVTSTSSIPSVSFAALEAVALSRGTTAWTRQALDLWRATVTTATATTTSPGTVAHSRRTANRIDTDDSDRRRLESSTADAVPPAPVPVPMGLHTATATIQRLIQFRQQVNPQGGDLIARASSLSDTQRLDLRQMVAEIASTRESALAGIDAHHWQAIIDTMIAVSVSIPDAHREVLYRSILDNAPDIDIDAENGVLPADATGRYYASVATALASDTVLDLDLLAESAIARAASSSPDDLDLNALGPFPPTSPNRPPAMPEDFIAYLTSTNFGQGRTPPAGFDIWLRQSVYSGAYVLRPVIATAAEDEALAERWLDLIPQPLWPGIARLSSRDTPQVAQMLRVSSDITDLFATTVETVAPASLQRARWRFLFPWLFLPQRPFDAATFAISLVAQLARHANVAVPPALASRVQQQTGIDMRTADVTDDAHLLQTPLMVPYAGMVLTWPFTTHLWDKLGLTKEHRFVSDEAAERAVLLLHYVGSGLTEAPEPHLTMHKLLCGLRFDTPVARHLDITEDESMMCEQMLDVIIQYWSALGNTSRDGLRGSFLQREGRLSLEEDGWHLKVRRAPYDMLLDRLPWSIATIRLSWMEQTLWVEWA